MDTCAECGKDVYVGKGIKTEWRDKERLPQPTFFCLTCLRKIENAGRKQRNAKVLAVRQSWLLEARKQPPLKERENITMIQILKTLCTQPGWYALHEITAFYLKAHPGTDPMGVSNVLRHLGFTERARKKRGSYMYVFIDPTKIPVNNSN